MTLLAILCTSPFAAGCSKDALEDVPQTRRQVEWRGAIYDPSEDLLHVKVVGGKGCVATVKSKSGNQVFVEARCRDQKPCLENDTYNCPIQYARLTVTKRSRFVDVATGKEPKVCIAPRHPAPSGRCELTPSILL